MIYKVRIKKKVARGLKKLPLDAQKILFLLIEDLKEDGPIQKTWPNFSPLAKINTIATVPIDIWHAGPTTREK